MATNETFNKSIAQCADAMNSVTSDWMIFGGAAMAMHGLSEPEVSDIDIVTTTEAAADLAQALKLENQADRGSARFRSTIFLKPDFGAVPVEIMAGFEVFRHPNWVPILPVDHIEMSVHGTSVNLASRQKLKEIFELCGRDKDLLRAARL